MPFPYAPIPQAPGEWSDLFDRQAIEMTLSHNMFIRGINAIYAQAEKITEQQAKPFTFTSIEESLIFPFYETKMGLHSMDHNIEQHHAFMSGLDDFQSYLKAVEAGTEKYSGQTIIEKLNTFSDTLIQHLREEIPSLESSKIRAAFSKKDLEDLEARMGKTIIKEISVTTTLPMGLICHDRSTAPYFPPEAPSMGCAIRFVPFTQ